MGHYIPPPRDGYTRSLSGHPLIEMKCCSKVERVSLLKELFPIVLAYAVWGQGFTKSCVVVHCDSSCLS